MNKFTRTVLSVLLMIPSCFVGQVMAESATTTSNLAVQSIATSVEHQWQWHGFVAQGIIDVDGSNFVNDDGALSAELTEIGLNTSYQWHRDLRLAAQVVYLNGGNRYHEGARIDYLLLDWSLYNSNDWQVDLFIGRFKNNHWLYSGARDIPFARPTIILPQSIYFDSLRDFAVGGDGLSLKVSYNHQTLGDFDFSLSHGTSSVSKQQTKIILSDAANGIAKHDYDIQASAYWQPTFSQWRFGLSLLDSDFSYHSEAQDSFKDAHFTFQFYTINALYEGERWEFSAEVAQSRMVTDGFYVAGFHLDNIGQGYYLQSRYKMTNELTLVARMEKFYSNKDDKNGHQLAATSQGTIPEYFAFQNDNTIGLSYDLANNARLRFEYHWLSGTARLPSIVVPNVQINDSKYWQMWAMQLMYWF